MHPSKCGIFNVNFAAPVPQALEQKHKPVPDHIERTKKFLKVLPRNKITMQFCFLSIVG